MDFPGTPGTFTGLFLRISQFLFAAGAIASMATAEGFTNYTAFCYLIASMGLQVIWSLGLAFLDAYALSKKKLLRNAILVSLFVVGDWVTATLSLAAACSSAGIIVLYDRDLGYWVGRKISGFFVIILVLIYTVVYEIFHTVVTKEELLNEVVVNETHYTNLMCL